MLVAAKEAVEANWKNTMWAAISNKMEEMGARKFPSEFLLKEYKKLEAAGTSASTDNGVGVSAGSVYAPTVPPALVAAQSAGNKARATAANGNTKAKGAEDGASKLLEATAKALAAASEDETDDEVKEEGSEDETAAAEE
ncbi:MAG: hypothetical protein Q9224_002354 [Gallowayella concinna]